MVHYQRMLSKFFSLFEFTLFKSITNGVVYLYSFSKYAFNELCEVEVYNKRKIQSLESLWLLMQWLLFARESTPRIFIVLLNHANFSKLQNRYRMKQFSQRKGGLMLLCLICDRIAYFCHSFTSL